MKKLLVILAILLLPSLAYAQASINVPATDIVYRAIDRLVAAGLVDNVIIGQRPFSVDEIARILIEAEKNFDRLENPVDKMMVYRLLKYWKKEYKDEIRMVESGSRGEWQVRFLDFLNINYDYLSTKDRNVFNNGLGTVNEFVQPLTEYSDGRHYVDGHNLSFETDHWVRGPYFAFFVHPRFQFQFVPDNREPENEAVVHQLYAKFGINNFELEVGRDELIWGQGENGGLLFSTNDRPVGFIKISNPHPFKLPWVFKHLGNIKGSILLSNFGDKHNYRYTYLSAWKLTVQPTRLVEVGFFYAFMIGGDGAPKNSAGDVARSFFGFIPRVSKAGISDQVGGFDFRFRIPPLSDIELYGEVYFQNPDLSEPAVMFRDRSAYIGGIYLPRLDKQHNMALRFEYRHTSPIIYRSFIWPDGFSLSGEVLGCPLGPAGDGVYVNYYYDLGTASLLTARFAYERRGGDFYTPRSDGGFNLTAGRSTEERYRGTISLNHEMGKRVRAKWTFGYEKALNFNFTSGNTLNSFLGGLTLSFDIGL